MDPIHRREVWEAIKALCRERVVCLTSHSMDEVQELGERIAIMANGRIRAIGSSIFLKNKYGQGYSLKLWINQKKADAVVKLIKITLPQSTIVGNQAGLINLAVKRRHLKHIPVLFRALDQLKLTAPNVNDDCAVNGGIDNHADAQVELPSVLREWQLSNSSLEEVFVRLAVANSSVNSGGKNDHDDQLEVGVCTVCRVRPTTDVTVMSAGGVPMMLQGVMCRPCSFGALMADAEAKKDDDARIAAALVDAADAADDHTNKIDWEASNAHVEAEQHDDNAADRFRADRRTPLDLMGSEKPSSITQIRAIVSKNIALALTERKTWIVRGIVMIILIVVLLLMSPRIDTTPRCQQGNHGTQGCDSSVLFNSYFQMPFRYSAPVQSWLSNTANIALAISNSSNIQMNQFDIGRGLGQWNDSPK